MRSVNDLLPADSSWEKSKSQSDWHYDYARAPIPGTDSFTSVCRFVGDLKSAVEESIATNPMRSKRTDSFTKNLEEDLSKLEKPIFLSSANPCVDFYDQYQVDNIKTFRSMSDALGLEHSILRLNLQRPGQMIPAHLDELEGFKKNLLRKGIEVDQDFLYSKAMRFVVMLDDWKLGQFFQLGNATWHQWCAGDCITWDWKNIPHCTGNAGYWSRPMLQLTGFITDKTKELLSSKDKDTAIPV